MRHLNDNEIQSLLHHTADELRKGANLHLSKCSDCEKKLLLYKKLGNVITSAPRNPIPNGFETSVMFKLRAIRRQKRVLDVLVAVVAFIGFLLIGSTVLLSPQLNRAVTGFLSDVWQYGGVEGMLDSIPVALFGVALLLLFSMIDRVAVGRLTPAIRSGECLKK